MNDLNQRNQSIDHSSMEEQKDSNNSFLQNQNQITKPDNNMQPEEYDSEYEDSESKKVVKNRGDQDVQFNHSQVSVEEEQQLIQKSKTKLEKLLCQPDIFDTLRRINNGQIKSYDELDQNHAQNQALAQNQSRRRGNNAKNDDLEELNQTENDKLFEIQKIEKQPDNLIGGILRDYQVEGLNWLYKLQQTKLNGILADEMGLGKTIQSIAIMALVESFKTQEQRESRKTHHIVIVPKIVLGKWNKEIQEWVPSLRLKQFYGSNEEREIQKQEMRQHQFDIMLTTFETVIREKGELSKYHFEFLILDEAQRIKNDESVLSQVLRKFKTQHRILLTGTPLQNNLKELWALLNFLMPKLFDSAEEFKELFMIKNEYEGAQEQIIRQIHRLLRPFMLRRLKVDVEKNLPTKKEIYLFIGLSKLQKQLYKNILTGNIDVVNGVGDKIKLLNVLMQLKKVCNHPYLFDKVEPGPPFLDGEHLIDNCMKFKVLDLLVPKLLNQGCKILIFSQMTRLLDILDDFLRFRGYQYCRIDGQTSANDREIRIEEFQKADSTKQLFILSTRAGGLGINLHSANVVIIFDSDWNPQVDLQAIDRAHRIGQKRDVVVYRFVTEGSVEEKIVERAARKLRVDHLIMQKGKFGGGNDNNPNKMNAQEMLQMIKYGAQEIILTDQEGQSMDANIDNIIEHSMKRTEEINKELSKLEEKFNLNNVSLTGEDEKQTNLYTFEGQDYKRKPQVQGNDLDFINIGQRERKQMSYDIDKYYREALNMPTQTKEKKKLKGWKASNGGGYEHQFFDNAKLEALDTKEQTWNTYAQNPDEFLKNLEIKEKPPQFTFKDQQQREKLLKQGFPNWSKKDFFQYIRMCETFGRDNYAKIAEAFPTKTIEEVKQYSKAFWLKWQDYIENGQKYVERIERGEAEIQKYKSIEQAIEDKFHYAFKHFLENNPDKQLKDFTLNDLSLFGQKPQQSFNNFEFSEDEDKFIALSLYKYGYGSWELIRNELRNNDRFMLNWIVKTRTVQDIQKRCDLLIQRFKKEVQLIKKNEEEIRIAKEEEELRLKKQQKSKHESSNKSQSNSRVEIKNVSKKNIKAISSKSNSKNLKKRGKLDNGIDDDSENSEIENISSSDDKSDISEFRAHKPKAAKEATLQQSEAVRITRRSEQKNQESQKNGNQNNHVTPIKKREEKQISKSSIIDVKSAKKSTAPVSDSQNSHQPVRKSTRRTAQSPKEKTPEYYDVSTTYQGEVLNFRSNSINRKTYNIPQAQRFPQYNFYKNNTGASSFLGPGTYNDHEDFLKLTQQPCSLKMRKISVLPEKESGKPCYIMVGNNLAFEPSFLSTRDQKRELSSLNADQCPVNLKSTLHKRSISNIKQRLNFTMKTSTQDVINKQDSFSLPQALNNQYLTQNGSQENQFVNSFHIANNQQQNQRPQTCQNCNSSMNTQGLNVGHQSAKASMSGKVTAEFSNTIGHSSMMDKSTTLEMSSMKQIQEEGSSLPEILSTPGQDGYLSEENQVRIKSMLPKTAANFSKMKRGLYLNPVRGFPYNIKEEALARSINILAAYGEIIPSLGQSTKKKQRARSTSKRSKTRRSLMNDSVHMTPDSLHGGQGYMNVIRDSQQVVNHREHLERQKREILNMKFDSSNRKKDSNHDMNKFLSDRYSNEDQKDDKSEASKAYTNNNDTNNG